MRSRSKRTSSRSTRRLKPPAQVKRVSDSRSSLTKSAISRNVAPVPQRKPLTRFPLPRRRANKALSISEKMAANLAAIVDKTRQLDERIGEIAQSSHEQSEGIGQLNSAVASMDKITQDNAALAEESSASAEELKSQAEQVRLAVAELMRMAQGSDDSSNYHEAVAPVAAEKVRTPVVARRAHSQFRTGKTSAPHRVASAVKSDKAGSSSHSSNGGNGTNGHDNVDKFFA